MEENKNTEPEQPVENIPATGPPQDSEIGGEVGRSEIPPANGEQPLNELNNSNDSNDNMEVHHHAHHEHGKKSWKSYFWEFLMLFLAVFCGFLAEYALEHKIEADREEQYMYSLSEDLRRDTAKLNESIEFGQNQKLLIDSLIDLVYHQPLTQENIARLYMLHFSSYRTIGLNLEDRTTVQLRNAGGMRLLRNTTTVDSIITYWNRLETIEFIKERLHESGDDIGDLAVQLFHTKFIISGDMPLSPPKAIKDDAVLIDNDSKLMAQFINRQYIKRVRLSNYINNMKLVKEKAMRLLETIRKEYHIN